MARATNESERQIPQTLRSRAAGDDASPALHGDFHSSWYLDKGQTSGWLEVDLAQQESFNTLSLVEPVGGSDDYPESRIRNYRFQHWNGERWVTLVGGETPVPTTIHRIPRVRSRRVRLLLESCAEMPHIADIGVYDEPNEEALS